MLNFGDIIRLEESEYVYLAASTELIFLAKIVNPQQTQLLELSHSKLPVDNPKRNNPVYLFVVLTTEEFEGCAAHLHNTDHDIDGVSCEELGILNDRDLTEIKAEILNPDNSIPPALREQIEKII